MTGIFKFAWWDSTWECENKKTKCILLFFPKFCQWISAKPIAFQHNLPQKFLQNWLLLQIFLFFLFCLNLPWKFSENSCEIYHFPQICLWKSHKIWLFGPQPIRSPEDTRLMSQVTHQAGFCGMNEWDAILT